MTLRLSEIIEFPEYKEGIILFTGCRVMFGIDETYKEQLFNLEKTQKYDENKISRM